MIIALLGKGGAHVCVGYVERPSFVEKMTRAGRADWTTRVSFADHDE